MPRPAAELLDPARYPYRIAVPTRYGDLDPNLHVNNVAMMTIFEDARVRFLGQPSLNLLRAGRRVMVVSLHVDYLAQTHYPGTVDVAVGVLAIGRSSWTLAELALQDGEPCALMQATTVASDGARALPLAPTAREALGLLSVRLGDAG